MLCVIISKLGSPSETEDRKLKDLEESIKKESISSEIRISNDIQSGFKNFGAMISANQKETGETQSEKIAVIGDMITGSIGDMKDMLSENQKRSGENVSDRLNMLETRFKTLESNIIQSLGDMRQSVTTRLTDIREDNEKRLNAIEKTVNEKLDSKIDDKFRLVSERLEQVYKGLGEMQSIASGVDDLKKVLLNVKSRGVMGEIQLGAILNQILAHEQYAENVETIPNTGKYVEFAVKLPGSDDGNEIIYLPIDSKFPGDAYSNLQNAYDTEDKNKIKDARKKLFDSVRKSAKDIRDKYVQPPYTTNFGIMFLPFEGLYAEIANSGLIEEMQSNYNIVITGPSTLAAMLNTLRMGFNTLAISKKTSEVWDLLKDVRAQFDKFTEDLSKAGDHIRMAGEDIDRLINTDAKKLTRRLDKAEIYELPDHPANDVADPS